MGYKYNLVIVVWNYCKWLVAANRQQICESVWKNVKFFSKSLAANWAKRSLRATAGMLQVQASARPDQGRGHFPASGGQVREQGRGLVTPIGVGTWKYWKWRCFRLVPYCFMLFLFLCSSAFLFWVKKNEKCIWITRGICIRRSCHQFSGAEKLDELTANSWFVTG